MRDSFCISKSCSQPAFVGYSSGGSCSMGTEGKLGEVGCLLPCAPEHSAHVRTYTRVSEAERSRQLCRWCWPFLAASPLGKDNLDLWSSWPLQPTAGLLPGCLGPCRWHAGYASRAGMALLQLFYSVCRSIYRQEKIDSITQCWSYEL